MVAKREDRRVNRTQRLLRDALLSLIRERGFEALTVQDIIDRANVGRSTFYAHFRSKEDLLVLGLDELRAFLKGLQRKALDGVASRDERAFAFSSELFAHVRDHRDVFRAMVGKRSGAVIQRRFQKMVTELVREDVKALASGGNRGAVPSEAIVNYVASGLWGLLSWWMDDQMRVPVEDAASLFRKLAMVAVKSALAPGSASAPVRSPAP